jgi:ATP-dependent Clp protease ATP-binding subunit ClpB
MAVVRQSFKPEYLNRLDEIVMIDALTPEELSRIVDLQIQELDRRLAARRISLDVTEKAHRWLGSTGYDPAYGARPLRRLVQTAIGDKLARMLLAGEVLDGSTVTVDVDESGRELTVRPAG